MCLSMDFVSLYINGNIDSCMCFVAFIAHSVDLPSKGSLEQSVHAVTMLFLFNWPCLLYIL